MKEIQIYFKSISDFKSRIARLWQEQKEDELYNFIFADEETENAFKELVSRFEEGQQGGSESTVNVVSE